MNKDSIIAIATLTGCLIILAIFLNSWSEDIIFYLANRKPVVSEITTKKINPLISPEQIDLPPFQKMYKIFTHQKIFFVEPVAQYDISGRILSKNMKLGLWGFSRKDFDYIALIDIVLGWDEVSDIELFEKYVSNLKQDRTPGGGRYYRFYVPADSRWSVSYVMSHTSHNHIIPANNNIMSVLYSIKKYDVVRMKGYLVDVYKDGEVISMTSMSRTDTDGTSRGRNAGKGGGSCEIFYVTSIQVGDKIYK